MARVTKETFAGPRASKLGRLFALAVVLSAGNVTAQDVDVPLSRSPLAAASVAELEQAFWTCDYVATIRGPAGADTAICAAVYDALKERKFRGDFDLLLAWWEKNKLAQHAARETMASSR